ncbi:MAG: hypothetical protein K0V04_18440 [Deltaproteobacteria bacterium]|nr:hypothetical protein [Deltaproteobacteria bacterium]
MYAQIRTTIRRVTSISACVAVFGTLAATACSSGADKECKKKFQTMLAPCVPKCAEEDPKGVGTDNCIRACVEEEFGEPIPQC